MTTAILVLTTGGTIDKNYFDALSEYQIVDSGIPALLSEARVALPFRVVEVMRKDSLELTAADRTLIAQAAREAPESRIVITHGTDTMTETAAALAAEAPGKTICLTGALSPARFSKLWSQLHVQLLRFLRHRACLTEPASFRPRTISEDARANHVRFSG